MVLHNEMQITHHSAVRNCCGRVCTSPGDLTIKTLTNSDARFFKMTTTTRFATHPLVRAVALAGAPLLMLGSVTAQAQSNTELEELRERIQVLEGKLEGAVSTAPETRDDSRYLLRDGKGIKIGDTTISFGGFIKADVIFGSNGDGTSNGYGIGLPRDRKSTRLNSSHVRISYAVFCLKKRKQTSTSPAPFDA